ncbi:hypothetical protein ACH5RR_021204 [Cinchona calisaya]|uniref:Uncharacterized protein n=1 Tax=Cinchona calisaya TaxID=153742 RepID=A0ABD2ZGM9_9GENT
MSFGKGFVVRFSRIRLSRSCLDLISLISYLRYTISDRRSLIVTDCLDLVWNLLRMVVKLYVSSNLGSLAKGLLRIGFRDSLNLARYSCHFSGSTICSISSRRRSCSFVRTLMVFASFPVGSSELSVRASSF